MMRWTQKPAYMIGAVAIAGLVLASLGARMRSSNRPATDIGATAADTIAHGRHMVIITDCSGCHGGFDNPENDGWMAGETTPDMQFIVGPCYLKPGAQPCWHTHPRNLTPDNETGLGRFTERQIFNALRYGLRPEDTPDVDITSTTPGQGNFPLHPHYLAFPMPWFAWRNMSDGDLWSIAAYLKRGLKPVHNKVAESEGPPDFWASFYKDEIKIGGYPVAPFPTKNEVGGK